MPRSKALRRLGLTGLLVLAGVLLSGCSLSDLPRFGWPVSATEQGRHMQYFWSAAFIAALIVGVIVWGAMFWAFAKHRQRPNSPLYPKQTKENLPFELVCTAIPFVLVAVLFYFTVTTQNKVLAKTANPDVTIDVTAFKWNWDFGYQGTKVPGAVALPATARDADWYNNTEVHTVGTSDEVPLLVLPVGKTIQFNLRSKDVIHSFWVPDFLFKRDVFPFPAQNQPDGGNVFQVKLERTGAFVGRCAELCGTYHSAMNFEVRSVPEDAYQAYVKIRSQVNPATGVPFKAAEALSRVQATVPSCGELCAPLATTTHPLDTDRQARSAPQNAGN
ncbi:cytochrome c oxidase subunit II [Nakamurella sp. A5-74]|uniref:Cytochrome c oxidase subunit II n=1 Tax=Nakamurella sp. A5-74 TaxID=3158264 RepID=A0AAU8DLM4_9ACTN